MTEPRPETISAPPEVDEFLANPSRGISMTRPRRQRVWRVQLTLRHGTLSVNDWRAAGDKMAEGDNFATFRYGEDTVAFTVDVGGNFDMEGAIRAAQAELATHIGVRTVGSLTIGCQVELMKGSVDG